MVKGCAITAVACNTVLSAVLLIQNKSILSGLGFGFSLIGLACVIAAVVIEKKEES